MKPHDEWNSADIADHARRAMHIETTDYANEPEPNLPPPDWMFRVYAVVCGALFMAVLVLVVRVW